MRSKVVLILICFISSCSTSQKTSSPVQKHRILEEEVNRDFSSAEVIQGSILLTKIYDKEIPPISCVPNIEEAALLQRTLGPRFDLAQDDFEANLDQSSEVEKLIDRCELNCSCHYIDELIREHQVPLSRPARKTLNEKKTTKELKRCLKEVQNNFCQSELYQSLEKEKNNFSFDEEVP